MRRIRPPCPRRRSRTGRPAASPAWISAVKPGVSVVTAICGERPCARRRRPRRRPRICRCAKAGAVARGRPVGPVWPSVASGASLSCSPSPPSGSKAPTPLSVTASPLLAAVAGVVVAAHREIDPPPAAAASSKPSENGQQRGACRAPSRLAPRSCGRRATRLPQDHRRLAAVLAIELGATRLELADDVVHRRRPVGRVLRHAALDQRSEAQRRIRAAVEHARDGLVDVLHRDA